MIRDVYCFEPVGDFSISLTPDGNLPDIKCVLRVSESKTFSVILEDKKTERTVSYDSANVPALKSGRIQLEERTSDGWKPEAIEGFRSTFQADKASWSAIDLEKLVALAMNVLNRAKGHDNATVRAGASKLHSQSDSGDRWWAVQRTRVGQRYSPICIPSSPAGNSVDSTARIRWLHQSDNGHRNCVTANDSRSEILELLKGGHFEEAIGLGYLWDRTEFNRAFLKVSSRWSADAEVRTELNKARNVLLGENDRQKGIRLFGFREFDVAREYFQRAASESGDGLDYQWLGRTLLELGQTEAAIQQFTNAVKTDGSANNLLWLGSALVTVDLRKDALVHFARAVEMRGDAADHYWYGKTLTELGRPRKAVRSLRLAVSGRGSPEDISWLGRALAAAGSKKKALAELSKAVSLRGWAEDCYWLGRTLAELKRGVDALPHLRKRSRLVVSLKIFIGWDVRFFKLV